MFVCSLSRDVDPVVFAIRGGDLKVVNDVATSSPRRLLKENKDGWIPLHEAAFCGQTECLKTLLKGTTRGALLQTPESVQCSIMWIIQERQNICLVKESGSFLAVLSDGDFSGAAHPGSVDKRTLREQTALLLAVSCGHSSCVRCLLEASADPDISSKNKETPLYKGTPVKSVVSPTAELFRPKQV